jgi:hypothetical protein
MRKLLSSILVLAICLTAFRPQEARAEGMPVKAKAFLTIVGYGAAGGAILGVASMAFGTSTRAVAQGASLGLYAGILFGSYVLFAHHQKRYGSYDDGSSPYSESTDVYTDEYQSDEGGGKSEDDDSGSSRGGFFDRFKTLQSELHYQNFTFQSEKKKGGQMPPIQMNIFQYNF